MDTVQTPAGLFSVKSHGRIHWSVRVKSVHVVGAGGGVQYSGEQPELVRGGTSWEANCGTGGATECLKGPPGSQQAELNAKSVDC